MLRRSFLTAGLAATLPLPAAHATPALERERLALGVGGKSVLYYLPLTVAERLGYFRDEGLTVEIADLAGGAKVLQTLLGGSTEVGVSSYDTTIRMQAKGQDVRAVIELGRFPGIALAVKKDRTADLTSFADLTKLKVGVSGPGSLTHIVVQYLVAKAEGDPRRVVAIRVGTGASAVAAIEQGELDAMCNAELIISKLEADGAVTVVADLRTEAGTRAIFGTPNPAAAVYLNGDFIAANPETVQALVNAFYRSLRWLAQATTEAMVDLVPASYHLGDRALYKRAVSASLELYSHWPRTARGSGGGAQAPQPIRPADRDDQDRPSRDLRRPVRARGPETLRCVRGSQPDPLRALRMSALERFPLNRARTRRL